MRGKPIPGVSFPVLVCPALGDQDEMLLDRDWSVAFDVSTLGERFDQFRAARVFSDEAVFGGLINDEGFVQSGQDAAIHLPMHIFTQGDGILTKFRKQILDLLAGK